MCEKCNDLKERIWEGVKTLSNSLDVHKSFSEWTNPFVDYKKFDKKIEEWYKILNKYFMWKSKKFRERYDNEADWVWFLWRSLINLWIKKAATRELNYEEIVAISNSIFDKSEFYEVVHSYYWEELPEWFLKEIKWWMIDEWIEQASTIIWINQQAQYNLNDYFYKWSWWYMSKIQQKLEDIVLYWFQDWKSTYDISKEIIKQIEWIAVNNARMIAQTESIRVSSEISIWVYKDIWVTYYEILPALTACPICQQAASLNPYKINDRSWMAPKHPRCRCSVIPVLSDLK